MITHFSKFGYSCPANFNPADYVMFLAQTESMEALEATGMLKVNDADAALIVSQVEESTKSNDQGSVVEFVQAPFLLVRASLIKILNCRLLIKMIFNLL